MNDSQISTRLNVEWNWETGHRPAQLSLAGSFAALLDVHGAIDPEGAGLSCHGALISASSAASFCNHGFVGATRSWKAGKKDERSEWVRVSHAVGMFSFSPFPSSPFKTIHNRFIRCRNCLFFLKQGPKECWPLTAKMTYQLLKLCCAFFNG